MLILVIAVLLIAGAVSFFYFSHNNGESVTINWMDQTGVFPLAWIPYVVLFLVLFLFALWLLGRLFSVPKNLRRGGEIRGLKRSRESLDKGLMEIQTGDFEKGEATLTSYIEGTPADAIKFIAAAKSAQWRGADDRAEQFLKKASDSSNEASTSVRITQAEMMLAQSNFRDAETLLINLHKARPKNAHIMSLLATAFEGTGNATKLAELTKLMRSKTNLPVERIAPLETSAWIRLMSECNDSDLARTWESLPPDARIQDDTIALYVRRLMDNGEHDRAETVLQKALNRNWSDPLISLYGKLDNSNTAKQLEQADRWLAKQPNNAALTLAMGRLFARRQLWGKARESLVKSAQSSLSTEVCSELGDVLEAMGDTEQAKDCFKSAAAIAVGKAPVGMLQDVTNLDKQLTNVSTRKAS